MYCGAGYVVAAQSGLFRVLRVGGTDMPGKTYMLSCSLQCRLEKPPWSGRSFSDSTPTAHLDPQLTSCHRAIADKDICRKSGHGKLTVDDSVETGVRMLSRHVGVLVHLRRQVPHLTLPPCFVPEARGLCLLLGICSDMFLEFPESDSSTFKLHMVTAGPYPCSLSTHTF